MKPDAEHPAAIAVVPATEALVKEIEARLTEALLANTPPNDVAPLAVVARDNDCALMA